MRLVYAQRWLVILISAGILISACNRPPTLEEPVLQPRIDVAPGSPLAIELNSETKVRAVVTGRRSPVAFASSDPAIASVDAATGVVRANALGTATITITAAAIAGLHETLVVNVVRVGTLPAMISEADMVGRMFRDLCPNTGATFVSRNVRAIHEFHDCQRLINNNAFESLVGIFAHENLIAHPHEEEYESGLVGAEIVNAGYGGATMAYEPLDLVPGTNCLVLKWTDGESQSESGGWKAAIVHVGGRGPSFPNCPDITWADVPDRQRTPLFVKMQVNGVAPDGTKLAPPVARWDWDPNKKVNYIGVRCGEAGWCEIGPKDFTPMPALKRGSRPIFKGYYDQQFLTGDNGLKSDVWGTVQPDPNMSDTLYVQRDTEWYSAATLALIEPGKGSPAYKRYKKALNLNDRFDVDSAQSYGIMEISSPPGKGKDWNVKVNGNSVGGGKLKFFDHSAHYGKNRIATVRWRWHDVETVSAAGAIRASGETVWSYCPEDGCCELGRLQ